MKTSIPEHHLVALIAFAAVEGIDLNELLADVVWDAAEQVYVSERFDVEIAVQVRDNSN